MLACLLAFNSHFTKCMNFLPVDCYCSCLQFSNGFCARKGKCRLVQVICVYIVFIDYVFAYICCAFDLWLNVLFKSGVSG